jgi:hypothetical protein
VLLPADRGLDLFALAVAVAAFLLLWRLRWQTHTVVAAGALLGVAWTLAPDALGL